MRDIEYLPPPPLTVAFVQSGVSVAVVLSIKWWWVTEGHAGTRHDGWLVIIVGRGKKKVGQSGTVFSKALNVTGKDGTGRREIASGRDISAIHGGKYRFNGWDGN